MSILIQKNFISNREVLIRRLVCDKRVLDVGCVDHKADRENELHWLHRDIASVAKEVVGLDSAEEEVCRLRRRGFNIEIGDATCFDLHRDFDVVVAGEVLEHLLNPGGFLSCARKHLAPGGRLILTVPNALCVNYGLQNIIGGREKDNPDHVTLHSATTLKMLLSKTGYIVEQIAYFPELGAEPRNLSYWLRWIVQMALAPIWPSLCHHVLVVARHAQDRNDIES